MIDNLLISESHYDASNLVLLVKKKVEHRISCSSPNLGNLVCIYYKKKRLIKFDCIKLKIRTSTVGATLVKTNKFVIAHSISVKGLIDT